MYTLTPTIRHGVERGLHDFVALHVKSCTPGPPVRVVYAFLALNHHKRGTVTLTYVDGQWKTTAVSVRWAAA